MSTPLHDALTEIADEITADDVPAGLAGSAWGAAELERRRARRGKVAGALAAAAAAGLAFWLVISAGTGLVDSSPADSPTDPVGLPQRVTFQEDPPPLPLRGGPVSALVEVGTRGMPPDDSRSRELINGGTRWQALTPDARLWSLDGDVAPVSTPILAGQELWMSADPALSPDGRVLALSRSVQQVIHADSTSKSTKGVRELLDLHDVTTGRHESIVNPCGVECAVADMRWSPDGRRLAALANGEDGPVLVTVTVGSEGVTTRRTSLSGSPTLAMAGWVEDQVLLVRLSEDAGLDVDGAIHPVLVDPADGTIADLPTQPLRSGIASGTHDASGLGVIDGQLAVRALASDTVSWQLFSLRSSEPESGVGWTPPPGAPKEIGGVAWLYDDPGSDGIAVTRAGTGGLAYVGISRSGVGTSLLTVLDPRLDTQDLRIARDALASPPTTSHPFGTRMSWWSWHPEITAGLVLTPFALMGLWFLVRRLRSRRG